MPIRKHTVQGDEVRLVVLPRTDQPGVDARHWRVAQIRGKAAEHLCTDCGKPAAEWSQTHGTDGLSSEDYSPRCRSCHRTYDRESYVVSNGNALKTHCLRAHPFDETNTLVSAGKRICRTCKRDDKRRQRAQANAHRSG